MTDLSTTQRPDGTVDTTELLRQTLEHMQKQNEHQFNQLVKGDEILRQLHKSNARTALLVFAAVILLVLGGIQQLQVMEFQRELQLARTRYADLERSMDQRISDTSASVVRKVDQLQQSTPRVVADSKGDISLSVPITAAPPKSVAAAPVPTVRPSKPKSPFVTPPPPTPTPSSNDFVLVPLKAIE
jgi:hypothetical protein